MSESEFHIRCTTAYENHYLYGGWVAISEPGEMAEEIEKILNRCPHDDGEDYVIDNYRGEILHLALNLGRYPDLEKLYIWNSMLRRHGDAFVAYTYCGFLPKDYRVHEKDFNERFMGEYETRRDFGREMFGTFYRETFGGNDVPDLFDRYMDYEEYAKSEVIPDIDEIRYNGKLFYFEESDYFDESDI